MAGVTGGWEEEALERETATPQSESKNAQIGRGSIRRPSPSQARERWASQPPILSLTKGGALSR